MTRTVNFCKPALLPGEPVITAKTKITVCPYYDPRFKEIIFPNVHEGAQRGRVSNETPESVLHGVRCNWPWGY